MRWFVPESQRAEGDEEVYALLAALHRLRGVWANFKPPGPIRRSDFMLLGTIAGLAGEGPVTVSGIARAMRQSVPGISQRVTELAQQGYILRETNQKDRRTASLRLTPGGEALLEEVNKVFRARARKVTESFGQEKTLQLLQLLEELQGVVQQTTQWEETDDLC